MALAHTPSPVEARSAGAPADTAIELPGLCPSWLSAEPVAAVAEPPAEGPIASLASVHPLHPAPEPMALDWTPMPSDIPSPGIESHPSFQHPAFQHPSFQHPSFQHPSIPMPSMSEQLPAGEQWATVLPFVRAEAPWAVHAPGFALEERGPIDYRPAWMGAAFLASTLCLYASSAPTWVSDPVALTSDSIFRRLAATSFQLFGTVTLTTVTGVAAVAFLLAGTQRLR